MMQEPFEIVGTCSNSARQDDEHLSFYYDELRSIAGSILGFHLRTHTLQPTALAHEAYLRLVRSSEPLGNDRGSILRRASRIMRHVLVDYARRRNALKRKGHRIPTELDEITSIDAKRSFDLIDLNEMLESLEKIDPLMVQVVELRYFCGLTLSETGRSLGVSPRTVSRAWRFAQAWLQTQLQ
ncbi:MAG: ECF-type sigma factor [Phycisphaerales bacterium]|nr:ECF-type sigma factor [Phycisphaerales bacterium]